MSIHLKPQGLVNVEPPDQELLTHQTAAYKAKAFEPRNLVLFFLIAFGVTWSGTALLFLGILKYPTSMAGFASVSGIVLLATGFGPSIAAFAMTAFSEGRSGVRALWRRFWNRNLSIRWLLVSLLILPALALAVNLVSRALDGQAYPILASAIQPGMVMAIVTQFLVAFIFNGLSEEFGWRGYALPHLQARWSALTSSLILGVIWAAWHLPVFFIPGTPLYQTDFWTWAPWIILSSVFYTWIFNNTKGSVLAAVLLHAMMNTGIIWCCGSSIWHSYGTRLFVVVLIVLLFGAKNLVRERQIGTIQAKGLTQA